ARGVRAARALGTRAAPLVRDSPVRLTWRLLWLSSGKWLQRERRPRGNIRESYPVHHRAGSPSKDAAMEKPRRERLSFETRVLLMLGLGVLTLGVVLCLPLWPQNPCYHNFADDRNLLGMPNLLNVLSNAPF